MLVFLNRTKAHLLQWPVQEDPPDFDEGEEILQPETILRHEDKVLQNGKVLRKYLIKFRKYPFEDTRWMQETQLQDSLALVQDYKVSPRVNQLSSCYFEVMFYG